MLAIILIITILNLALSFLALSSAGRQFIEREADRDAAIAAHNAIVQQLNKLATTEAWHAEEVQNLYTSLEIEREG